MFLHTRVCRLSLNTKVDLKKLRFFTIPHDGGSPMTSPVSKELMAVQRKVRLVRLLHTVCRKLLSENGVQPGGGGVSSESKSPRDVVHVLQVAQRLEADLGVTVQEVHFAELRYAFQIRGAYMSLPDKEGKVGPPGPSSCMRVRAMFSGSRGRVNLL